MEVRTVKAQLDCPPLKINGAPAPLRQLIEDFENDLHHIGDFTYAYFSTPKTRNVKPVILSNYPDSWLKSYVASNYHLIDPIIKHAWHSITPFFWREARNAVQGVETDDFLKRSAKYQLSSGATFTLHDASGLFAALSLCNARQQNDFDQRIREKAADIQMSLIRFHDRLIKTRAPHELFPQPTQCKLSTRETGVLKWVAMGKSYSEIAEIFSISERTVKFHMSNVSSKLEVRTAKQAVYKAINMGMV
ncbi:MULTISPECIES: helix-turn-helix transcriptional regulator [Pseudomonas]|uniref:LuxR family transcriptional regulator n=5 Tax=Pseudomonas syringae group genomosp. 2 TaxID=251698 RepID=A0ZSG2_PSEAJ|nr:MULTISPECIES: LuxR family transcriptional regulator [Pseudomonas syringae group genomosp. 2]KPX65547.1 PsyR [Pseudomonas amygdali pv. lachrymans]KIY17345.1 LuxR family transcriptional regulator [Pseudomonas amygdali pv. tabaci]KPX54617.1 PsyR [Pseudomonas amygdali pv. hibisci]KPY83046.1 PsyR [Pseudomonas amygdali pv. tabaci]PHN50473.1 LuxR family transcriptional regulator [Pseudomonas amygdali]